MDIAKQLADWREHPPEQWLTATTRYLPPGVTAVLVLAIAYQLATLTWTLAPGTSASTTLRSRLTSSGNAVVTNDYASLDRAHLFGDASGQPAAPAANVIDAPDTTLSVTLTGILANEEGNRGGAIIASGSEQRAYDVGNDILDADGATLHSVYADRVLLNRRGQLETLRLPKEPTAAQSSIDIAAPSQPAAAPAGTLREAITENATRLAEIVRPSLHMQEGQVVGFRVNPGRDRAAFEALGFQPGDVVTDVNGTVLDDASRGLLLFQSLGESTQANVTVLRDGVPQVIVVDTTQLRGLRQNRD